MIRDASPCSTPRHEDGLDRSYPDQRMQDRCGTMDKHRSAWEALTTLANVSVLIALPMLLFMLGHVVAPFAAPHTVAVFDFELIDTSLEGSTNGPRADEQARLTRTSVQLRQRLSDLAHVAIADIAPVAAEARASNLQACGGCDIRLARRVGADLAVTGTVQKVSNLILNMNIYIREVESGRMLAAASADLRGNTDAKSCGAAKQITWTVPRGLRPRWRTKTE